METSNFENSQEFSQKQIQMAAKGDQNAISQLYEATYHQVYHTVKSMVQDEDAVLDIVQDSYVKAFRSLDQLDKPENFRAWMKRIAANKAKDYFKKKRPVLFSEMVSEDDEEIDFQDDRTEHLPEEVIDRQETTRLISEILDSLSEEQRLVIGMFYYEQMSVREIAQILGCSENTVKSRLNYGRKKVEVKVRDLEKQGTKLYSLAPLPFLLWLFRMDAEAAMLPGEISQAEYIWSAVSASAADSASAGTSSAAASAAGTSTAAKSAAGASAVKSAAAAAGKAAVGEGLKAAGGKILVGKILAGILAVSVVGGGVTMAVKFGGSGQHTAAEATETTVAAAEAQALPETAQETVPAAEPDVMAQDVFEPVKNEYQKAMGATESTYAELDYQFINPESNALFYYYMCAPAFKFYTTNYDINHDGAEELLIGFGPDHDIQVVDVYAFDGDKPVNLISETALGSEWAHLQIMTDGTLYCSTRIDVYSSLHTLHKIAADGYSVNEIDRCLYTSGDDDAKLNAIQEKLAACTPVMDFSWTELTADSNQFTPNEADGAIVESEKIVAAYWEVYQMSDDEFNDDPPIYERYPYLDEMMYFYHADSANFVGMQLYYAMVDIDGDGISELLIGYGEEGNIQLCNSFAWNGKEMERLGAEGKCEILADGTVVDYVGNGGEIAGIYKLENSRLVENPDTELPLGWVDDYSAYLDAVNAHGGFYQPEWTSVSGHRD